MSSTEAASPQLTSLNGEVYPIHAGRIIPCADRAGAARKPFRSGFLAATNLIYPIRRLGIATRKRLAMVPVAIFGLIIVVGVPSDLNKQNEAARRRYDDRRAGGRCTDCNAPSQGAARCEECSRRSYERSSHFRGIPVWDPVYTVIEHATGVCHGPFDTEAEAAAGLVFAKLSYDQVEIVSDAPVTSSFTGWA